MSVPRVVGRTTCPHGAGQGSAARHGVQGSVARIARTGVSLEACADSPHAPASEESDVDESTSVVSKASIEPASPKAPQHLCPMG